MSDNRWTEEQLKLAFYLYCQLPFGKLHKGNKEVVLLASLIGRTPSAVAMKLVNFASLDPVITDSGRTGLGNASALDRKVWDEFHADWERLALECSQVNEQLQRKHGQPMLVPSGQDEQDGLEDFTGETRRAVIEQRVKQDFFRRSVLSSYRSRCCMSGLSESRLLVASHIVPWSKDKGNRLNPRNGLCLSALHDKAFDHGLLTLDRDFRIVISDELRRRAEPFIRDVLLPIAGKLIELPDRFLPDATLLAWHRNKVFVDNAKG